MYIKKHSQVTGGYKKLILGFVAVTVFLVLFIIYFSASKAVVEVKPNPTEIETDFVLDVVSDGGNQTAMQGVLFETEVQGSDSFKATGSKILDGDTIGQVSLINNRNEVQTLVKTTRLLADNGVLLRLNKRVNIPAGGQIQADVYADDPNAFSELQPTHFTIPGLWEGLQSEVYAESNSVITSSGESIKVVKAADIASGKEKLTQELYGRAIDEFNSEIKGDQYVSLVVSKKVVEQDIGAKIDEQVEEFEIKETLELVLVGLDQNKVIDLAGERLKNILPEGHGLANVDPGEFEYTVQSFDGDKKTAKVKVHIEGSAVIKADNPILRKEKIVGLSPKGVELYLANFEEVDSAEVFLSPFWVKKVPKMEDHVEIIILSKK